MKKLLFIATMILIWGLGLMISETKAQVAYGVAIVRTNDATRIVDGLSGTYLDYYAGLYYDPIVRGDIFRTDMVETSLDAGYAEGYADLIPAEVYLFTNNFVEGKTYCTYSQHFVRAYFYYSSYSQWFDPFRYSNFGNSGGSSYPGYPFSYYYWYTRVYRLGVTQACITISISPTPTPTPPTPTPTPTPCDPLADGSCNQTEAYFNVYPDIIRPKGLSGENETATAEVCLRPARANETVTLDLVVKPEFRDSGGHIAARHDGNRPLGKLSKTTGRTGSDGCFSATYYPSHIAGTVTINASVINKFGSENELIGIFNTQHLDEHDSYRLIGFKPWHPSPVSHWGTAGAVNGLQLIAFDYNNEYYNGGIPPLEQKIAYNDMSLPQGGKFDLAHKWLNSGSHAEHREGINCDVRSSNIPTSRWTRLNQIFFERGSIRTNDETGTEAPHWHLRFENDLDQSSQFSDMQNGIEQNPGNFIEVNTVEITPHSFVEDAWEILGRASTQAEWEVWHNRLVQAKAQGSTELLAEIKAYERSLFSDSEYIARHRTDEQFIEDVFWAHLFRQPTTTETAYWQDYLDNLPPIVTQQRGRMRLIADFQNLSDFEELVNNIVDSNIPPEPTPTP